MNISEARTKLILSEVVLGQRDESNRKNIVACNREELLTIVNDERAEIMCALVIQSCWVLCDPMDCSILGSSIHGILQAKTLEWVAMPFSRDLPHPEIDRVSCTGGRYCLSHQGSLAEIISAPKHFKFLNNGTVLQCTVTVVTGLLP